MYEPFLNDDRNKEAWGGDAESMGPQQSEHGSVWAYPE